MANNFLFDEQMTSHAHKIREGVRSLNSCELTVSITAAANALAAQLTNDQLNLLGVVLTQLGDTLFTIATTRELCASSGENASGKL